MGRRLPAFQAPRRFPKTFIATLLSACWRPGYSLATMVRMATECCGSPSAHVPSRGILVYFHARRDLRQYLRGCWKHAGRALEPHPERWLAGNACKAGVV